MIKMDDSELKRLERDLKDFARKAYPYATRHTINSAAFEARDEARTKIGSSMVLRNKHTVRGVMVNPAKGLRVSRQVAAVGSVDDYMERQEFGGTVAKKGKRGVPLATSYSARLPMHQEPRTKLPVKSNKLRNIKLKYGGGYKNKRGKWTPQQRTAAAIRVAAKSKGSHVFLGLPRSEGVFKVIGGKRKPALRMIYDLSHKSIRTPRNPWLAPSVGAAKAKIPGIYLDALRFQIGKQRLFR